MSKRQILMEGYKMASIPERNRSSSLLWSGKAHVTEFMHSDTKPVLYQVYPLFSGTSRIDVIKDYKIPRHQHTGYEIIYVDKGIYHCKHNDCIKELKKDEVLIIKPFDWHQDFLVKGLKYFTLNFALSAETGNNESLSIFREGLQDVRQQFTADRSLFLPIIKKICKECEKNDITSVYIRYGLMLEFFWNIIRALPEEIISNKIIHSSMENKFMVNIQNLFAEHITGNLSVPEMAKRLFTSESSLAHKCKYFFGEGPARNFTRAKMKHALQMINSTNMSIKEISEYLGFANQYHFSSTFKSIYGKAPSHFR